MNIFIIEDDRVLRTELMKLLCSYGYQCDYSEDWQSIVRPPTGCGEASGCKPDAGFVEQPKSVLCCIYEK